jgi:PKD repeat protein
MKTIRTFLFAVLLLPAFQLSAQCSGNFTWTVTGNNVSFSGTTSPLVTNVIWDFGDGNYDYSNTLSPSHTYTTQGVFTACILVMDSVNFCSDSTCHSILVDSCYATFSYTFNGTTGNFTGYANGGSPNSVYVWNFGDSSPDVYAQNPSHTYANAGTYNVCFAYYDLVTGCDDSVCMPVTVGGCTADFTWVDSLGYVFFIGSSSLGSNGNYFWDFGDGNYSSNQYPSHTYTSPGNYLVCLTVTDSLQNPCDSICHMITVTNVSGQEERINITGVSLSPNPSDENATLAFYMTQPGDAAIAVYDIAGREIVKPVQEQFSTGKQQVAINTQSFAPGIYFVQIIVNGQSVKSKLIVTHKQ